MTTAFAQAHADRHARRSRPQPKGADAAPHQRPKLPWTADRMCACRFKPGAAILKHKHVKNSCKLVLNGLCFSHSYHIKSNDNGV